VHEDRPGTDIWFKLIFLLPVVLLLVPAFVLYGTDGRSATGILYGAGATAAVMAALYFLILPTRYSILNDKLKITFRGPFTFNIPFSTIAAIRDGQWSTVGINLPTRFSQKDVLEIVRKKRMTVTITPADKREFTANFHKAFEDWKKGKDI